MSYKNHTRHTPAEARMCRVRGRADKSSGYVGGGSNAQCINGLQKDHKPLKADVLCKPMQFIVRLNLSGAI